MKGSLLYKKVGKLVISFVVSLGLVLSGSVVANAEDILEADTSPKPVNIGFVSRVGEATTFNWMLTNIKNKNDITSYKLVYQGTDNSGNRIYLSKDFISNGTTGTIDIPLNASIGTIAIYAFREKGSGSGWTSMPYAPSGNSGSVSHNPYILSVRPVSTSYTDKNELIIKWQAPNNIGTNTIMSYQIVYPQIISNGVITQKYEIIKIVSADIREAIIDIKQKTGATLSVVALYHNGSYGAYAYSYQEVNDYFTPCPDVQLIAARGSDEPLQDDDGTVIKGSEEQTLLTNEQISEALPGYVGIINGGVETVYAQNLTQEIKKKINPETGEPYTVDTYAVPYPAVKPVFGDAFNWSVDQFWVNNIAFGQSVNTGSEMTSNKIEKIRNLCPDTKIVLSGYSQGALAVAQATDALGKQDIHVDSIALFGDPFFNPKDDMADRSNYSFEHSGMLATREFWEQTTKAPVSSYCHDLDVFCNITSAYTKQLDPLVPTTAAAQNNGNMYAPHESYPEIWAPANNVQATLEAAQQTVKDLKL